MNPLSGILAALTVECQRKDPVKDVQKYTGTVAQSAAASSNIEQTFKIGTNFKSSNASEPKSKRSVAQVQSSVKEALDFLNTPEGRIISELYG